MKVILHKIQRAGDGSVELAVSLGSQPARVFRATYDDSDPRCLIAIFDEELFLSLSELALQRFGNCAVYQHELGKLVGAFCAGASLPDLPVVLGTTSFCTLKPTLTRVVWNKFCIFLRRVGLYRPRAYTVR